jgi:hypothetical protein
MKKLMAMLLSVALISTTVPQRTDASFITDFLGGIFTILSAPIWIFCQDNEFFRKQNPFRKKAWQEQEEIEEIVNSKFTKFDKRMDWIEKETGTAIINTLKGLIRLDARVSGIERFIYELTYVDIERSRAYDRLEELQKEAKRLIKKRLRKKTEN